MPGHAFDLDELRRGVRPFRLYWFPRVGSTNDHAARLRASGRLFAPAMVLAGQQLAGRGRGGNTWWSAPGGLAVTFVLPVEPHLSAHQVPLIAGLAVRRAVSQLLSDEAVQLKWPNDLVYADRKLAGLLCERIHKADLIGLGLNVNVRPAEVPRPLRSRVVAMSQIADRPLDRTKVLIEIARQIHRLLGLREELSFGRLRREYDRHHALIGRDIRVHGSAGSSPVSGVVEGLDSTGRLLLRDGPYLHRVIAGQVEIV